MYNVLYPNILSCNVMYYAVVKDIGEWLHVVIELFREMSVGVVF